jgi:hypothetical protein
MDRDLFVDPPALVRPAEDLGELAAVANAGYQAGEDAARQGIAHYIAAGEALVRAKKLCGHGRWLEWVRKNLCFGDRQARKLMRLYRERDRLKSELNSDLTIDAAAQILARRDDDEESAALEPPAPEPGCVYFCMGRDAGGGGTVYAEIAALPDAPTFWVWAFVFHEDGHVIYCGRGMRLDGLLGLDWLFQSIGFIPGLVGWQESPLGRPLLPLAGLYDLLDRRQCKGQYAWYTDAPAEWREELVHEGMKRWGLTEEPDEGPTSSYVERPADWRNRGRTGAATDAPSTGEPA